MSGDDAGTPESEIDPSMTEAGDGAVPDHSGDGALTAEEVVGEEGFLSVEGLVSDLEKVTSERDAHLDQLLRLQAEFENYRKAVARREADAVDRANDKLILEILPVLDACDGAIANGNEDVLPLRTTILEALAKQGLERLEPAGDPFDPEQHDAVMHEDSSDVDVPTVADVLRVGYGWRGRVIRPVMVKTIG